VTGVVLAPIVDVVDSVVAVEEDLTVVVLVETLGAGRFELSPIGLTIGNSSQIKR
jgi:hypothetical protein